MKLQESGAAPCRGYGSACLEDGRIDRSPHPGFLENGPRSFPAYPGGKSWDEVPGKTGSGKKFYRNVISGADFTADVNEFTERIQIVLFTLGDPKLNAVYNANADV